MERLWDRLAATGRSSGAEAAFRRVMEIDPEYVDGPVNAARARLQEGDRDRDAIYGDVFKSRVAGLGIQLVATAPRSPWQNPYVERFIGSVRREYFDHVVVLGADHAKRLRQRYLEYYEEYYERSRTHLSLAKDAPVARAVHRADGGEVVAIPRVGGLHHRYERLAA